MFLVNQKKYKKIFSPFCVVACLVLPNSTRFSIKSVKKFCVFAVCVETEVELKTLCGAPRGDLSVN